MSLKNNMYIYIYNLFIYILPYTSSTWGSGLWELQPHLSLGGEQSALCLLLIHHTSLALSGSYTTHTTTQCVGVTSTPLSAHLSEYTTSCILYLCPEFLCVCVGGFVCLQTLPLTAGDHPDTKWLTLLPSVRLKLMYALFLPPVEGRTWEKQHADTD